LTLEQNAAEAYKILAALPSLEIDLNEVTNQLEQDGVEKFNASLDKLLASLKKKQAATQEPVER
jgi:transaldolase